MTFIILLNLLPLTASAYDDLDPEADIELTLTDKMDGVVIPGAEFQLYHVGELEVTNSQAEISLSEEYASAPVSLADGTEEENWASLANALEGYIFLCNNSDNESDHISPEASGKTGEDGTLTFDDLDTGLYLLIGEPTQVGDNVYHPSATLLTLPYWEEKTTTQSGQTNGRWDYDPDIVVKNSITPVTLDNIEIKVVKVWEDEGHTDSRPDSVTVVLFRDGIALEPVTLNAANNWRYVWDNMNAKYDYTIMENNVPDGYTVKIDIASDITTVTNSYVEPTTTPTPTPTPTATPSEEPSASPSVTPSEQPNSNSPSPSPTDATTTKPPQITSTSTTTTTKLPQTGQLWWPVSVLALFGMAVFFVGFVVYRKGRDE
jgi:hypothetical protein